MNETYLQQIDAKIDNQAGKIEKLAESISQLATAIAVKEERDRRIDHSIEAINRRLDHVETDVGTVKDYVSTERAFTDMRGHAIKAAIGVVIVSIVYALADYIK